MDEPGPEPVEGGHLERGVEDAVDSALEGVTEASSAGREVREQLDGFVEVAAAAEEVEQGGQEDDLKTGCF